MRRNKILAVLSLSLTLAAAGCASGATGGGTGGAGANSGDGSGVSTRDVAGVGTVLVNSTGAALYFNDQDSAATIKCMNDCVRIWPAVALPGGAAPQLAGVGGALSVVSRPDGTRQLALDGKPLYTFSLDNGGQVSGNGAKDSFAGTGFVWHAAIVGGSAPSPTGDGSAPSPTGDGSGGYSGGGMGY
jgi:predicted lipoprotein with Yx(FWY)xxD motif